MSKLDIYEKIKKNFVIIEKGESEFFAKNIKKVALSVNESVDFFNLKAMTYLLTNYSDNVLDVFSNGLDYVSVGYISNGDYNKIGSMKKNDFAKLAIKLAQMGKLNNNPQISETIKELEKLTSVQQIEPSTFSIKIDGRNYDFDTLTIVQFLTEGYKNYDYRVVPNDFSGLSQNEFFYVLKTFIIEKKLKYKFRFDNATERFLNKILSDHFANTVHFNKFLSTRDDNLGEFLLDEEFVHQILDDMPKKYNSIQKAIYVYIKLCKVLTYDPEFYANSQRGMVARKHEDITRLSTINAKNTQIVCYEFAQIFGQFLAKLDINYEVMGPLKYGTAHSKISFRAGDFIVSADSVTSILGGDLYNAKINNELVGLVCKNKNIKTRAQFKKICTSVYLDIISKERLEKSDESIFEEFLQMFNTLCKEESVSKQDKFKIFEKQSQDVNLPTIEKITYLMQLAKNIFAREKRLGKFDATIVSRKTISKLTIKSEPIIVFAFNDFSFKTNINDTTYYFVGIDGLKKPVPKNELNMMLGSGMIKYIGGAKARHYIPGFEAEEQNVR